METVGSETVRSRRVGDTAVIYAGDYLNKLSGERIERECKRQLDSGCQTLVIDFRGTELVNSIGISILLGVIDVAEKSGARLINSTNSPRSAVSSPLASAIFSTSASFHPLATGLARSTSSLRPPHAPARRQRETAIRSQRAALRRGQQSDTRAPLRYTRWRSESRLARRAVRRTRRRRG